MTHPLHWFDSSSLKSKFYLLGFFCLLVLALPTGLYWLEARTAIEFSRTEINGLAPSKAMFRLIQRSQQFRGLAVLYLKNHEPQNLNDSLPPFLIQKALEVDESLLEAKKAISKTHSRELNLAFDEINQEWQYLKPQSLNTPIPWPQYFEAQKNFLRKELDLLQAIVDIHQLSLDPEADGYFLISAGLMQLPELTETLGQMRALGAIYLNDSQPSAEQTAAMSALLSISHDKLKSIDTAIAKAVKANKNQSPRIFDQYSSTKIQYDKISQLVHSSILQPTKSQSIAHVDYSAESYFSAFTLSINSFFNYADAANAEIEQRLANRITDKNKSIYALLFYCFILFAAAAFLVLRFIHQLTQQLGGEPSYASSIVKRITQGNLQEPIVANNPESLLADMQKMQLKLQEIDRLKSEFVSTVSHELRTPLTSISGALAISLSGKLGELPIQMKDILSIAHKNSARLTELINDLLDIDKLIAGQLVFESKPVSLMLVIEETRQSLKSFSEKFGVIIESVSNINQAYIMADERRLRQVLTNLVSNAIKFSPSGEKVYINLSLHNTRARIEVVDQGSGISEEFRPRIFQKFSQADSSDRRSQGGTGLGLAISKALVTQMGGEIGFHSSVGLGSCFFIEFETTAFLLDDQADANLSSADNIQPQQKKGEHD